MDTVDNVLKLYGLIEDESGYETEKMFDRLKSRKTEKTSLYERKSFKKLMIRDVYDFREKFGINEEMTKIEREMYRHLSIKYKLEKDRFELWGSCEALAILGIYKTKETYGMDKTLELMGPEFALTKMFNNKEAIKSANKKWQQTAEKIEGDIQAINIAKFREEMEIAQGLEVKLIKDKFEKLRRYS